MAETKERLSKKTLRLVRKTFGSSSFIEDLSAGLKKLKDSDLLKGLEARELEAFLSLENFPKLLDLIETSSLQYEDQLDFAVRNLSISSAELVESNNSLSAMMNALEEGFLTLNAEGVASTVFTKVCENIFGQIPQGHSLGDLLRLSESEKADLSNWIQLVFQARVDFESLKSLGPGRFETEDNRVFSISYHQIIEANTVTALVATFKEITNEIRLLKEANEKAVQSERLLKMTQDRGDLTDVLDFYLEIQSRMSQKTWSGDAQKKLLRDLHTLKGAVATFYFSETVTKIHEIEGWFKEQQLDHPEGVELPDLTQKSVELSQSINFYLDDFQKQLGFHPLDGNIIQIPMDKVITFFEGSEASAMRSDAKEQISQFLFDESLKKIMMKYKSSIADLSYELCKEVRYQVSGEDLFISKKLYKRLFLAIHHLFKNSIVHGVETHEDRLAAGKDPVATLSAKIEAKKRDSHHSIQLTIEDDGKGLDSEALLQRFKKNDPENELIAKSLSEDEILQLVFHPGFTTQNHADHNSGRGVGLDAVRSEVEALGGTIKVLSEKGKGTKFLIKVPKLSEDRPWESKRICQVPRRLSDAS